jgi:hypothetical protein
MRHTIWTLTLMITIGVLGFTAGWNAQTTRGTQILSLVETAEPHVVLAKAGARQQKETLKQNEGCLVMPNEGLGQPKATEQESSIMKGLVF